MVFVMESVSWAAPMVATTDFSRPINVSTDKWILTVRNIDVITSSFHFIPSSEKRLSRNGSTSLKCMTYCSNESQHSAQIEIVIVHT